MTMNESMYDDDTLRLDEERENARLIVDLLNYTKTLEEMVINLRKEVNERTLKSQPIPYFELHSDVYESFEDYPAYEKHRDYIRVFLND